MRKQEFLDQLKSRLSARDAEEQLGFYSEMIDDRMEEGLSEEDAVASIGSVDSIAGQIATDEQTVKKEKKRISVKRRMGAGEIVLLALGSPIWLALLISAFAVVISLYAVLWSLVVSAWAVFASFVACAPAGVAIGIFFAVTGSVPSGIATIGSGILLAGLSIFAFFGCIAATKGGVGLTKMGAIAIARCFRRKEGV